VIVSARQDAIGTFQGNPVPQVLRDTFVLLADDDTWKLATLHMSFIAGTPGAPPITTMSSRGSIRPYGDSTDTQGAENAHHHQ
jgi:hypothetical protein